MSSIIKVFPFLFILFLLLGCEQKALVEKPLKYNKDLVQFDYPGNWKVSEDVAEDTARTITVETPGDAILLIQIFDVATGFELRDFVDIFSDAAKSEIGLQIVPSFTDAETIAGYEYIKETFSISILGNSVAHTRNYRRKILNDKICFIVDQVADDDVSYVDQGFAQIINSFNHTKK